MLLVLEPAAGRRAAEMLEAGGWHVQGRAVGEQPSGQVNILVPDPVALVPSADALECSAPNQQASAGGLLIRAHGPAVVERVAQVLSGPGVARPEPLDAC